VEGKKKKRCELKGRRERGVEGEERRRIRGRKEFE